MERIILDVDTGHDDAVAIDLAAGSPEIKIEGLIAVSGNQVLEHTLNNTLNMAETLKIDAPVYAGAQGPLVRERVAAGYIHGPNGFAGPEFGPRKVKEVEKGYATDFIIDTIMSNPGEITYVSVGPYTDFAIAYRKEPRIGQNVKKVVVMGGSSKAGNVTPQAEFNVYADPDAAQVLYHCGAPVYIMPLDVTLQVILKPEKLEEIKKIGGRAVEIFGASMEKYTEACLKAGGEYPAMHDPCCIAYLIDPSIFGFTTQDVQIELAGKHTYGRTCVMRPDPESKIHWGRTVDADKFWALLKRAFTNLKEVC